MRAQLVAPYDEIGTRRYEAIREAATPYAHPPRPQYRDLRNRARRRLLADLLSYPKDKLSVDLVMARARKYRVPLEDPEGLLRGLLKL